MRPKQWLIFFIVVLGCIIQLNAQQYTKIHEFNQADGAAPWGELVSDGTYLYGMTYAGGAYSLGVIFKVKPDGSNYTKLFDFSNASGASHPYGSLITDSTYLYGMSSGGWCGSVFKIKTDGTAFTILQNFTLTTNNVCSPRSSLLLKNNFLYGMSEYGGVNNRGTIFKVQTNGSNFSKIFDFSGNNGEGKPYGTLISDGTYLYGTSNGVNGGYGNVFKILPDGTGYASIFNFTNYLNGVSPLGTLFFDGNFLYGTTNGGGTATSGSGTIFKVMPDGSNFTKLSSSVYFPWGSLIYDGIFLYGMTPGGGFLNSGQIFKIKPDGSGFSFLFDFDNYLLKGSNPYGSLLMMGKNLYGLCQVGGTYSAGVVFKLDNSVNLTGLNDNGNRLSINVFPNPFSFQIMIESKNELNNANIKFYNSVGQVVKEESSINGRNHIISREGLPNGIYFIELSQNNIIIFTQKVFITE